MGDDTFLLQNIIIDTYSLESPLEIESGLLLLNKTTREVSLQLRVNVIKITNSEISSVTLNVECRDDAGDLIPEINPFKYTYRDIFLLNSKSFGAINPIVLDTRVRRVKVSIYRVVFMDCTVWSPIEEGFKSPEQILVNSLSADLLEQLYRDILSLPQMNIERVVFVPQQLDEYWLCTCGRPNKKDAEECCRCGFSKTLVFNVFNLEHIQQKLENYKENIRLEAERVQSLKERARLREEEVNHQQEEERVRKLEQERVHSKKRNTFLILAGSIGLLIVLFYLVALPAINYAQASKFLANKEYNYAIYMFHALGNYKDSNELLNEANYQKATNLLAAKEYDEARKVFSYNTNYKYSGDMINEANYQKANDLLLNKQYDESITIFKSLEGYKNSIELVKEAKYLKAVDLFASSKYYESIELFTDLQGYKDSGNRLIEAQYLLALQYIGEYKFDEAIIIFENLGEYKDSRNLLEQANKGLEDEEKYQDGVDKFNNGAFIESKHIFELISYYKDSNTYVGKLRSLVGIQGTWQSTIDTSKFVFNGWHCILYYGLYDSEPTADIQIDTVTNTGINYFPFFEDSYVYIEYRLGSNEFIFVNIRYRKID
jgi:TolA-binding protein